jgi:thiol-disulfide isomerase/thioredoxin
MHPIASVVPLFLIFGGLPAAACSPETCTGTMSPRDLGEFLKQATAKPRTQSRSQPKTVEVRTPNGAWHAWLDSPGGKLPFGLRFRMSKGVLAASVHNGPERIPIPVVAFKAGKLTLGFDYYDSRITAKLDKAGKRFDGQWTKRRGGKKVVTMQFHAVSGRQSRFAVLGSREVVPFVVDRWRVQFEKDKHPAVGVFKRVGESIIQGTFLTTLGDYRYLAGTQDGRLVRLSCFDGAHAFLFEARLGTDMRLEGDFWSSNTWHERWSAKRDENASLPDAWKLTTADTSHLGRLRFPDLEGRPRALSDPAFAGKARILVVFGSWCPNCKDETAYLVELDRRYRKRGLSIVGLAFEHSGDAKRDMQQLKTYAKRQGIRFPLLLAGLSDKAKASQVLPLLDRVRSYPTTLFLHEDGRLHSVHTGFSGPGTGPEYTKLRERFDSIIEELLKS